MSKKRNQQKQAPSLTPAKRRVFIWTALLLPVLLLIAAEGVLRLVGHGGYDPVMRIAGEVEEGNLVITDQAGAISYFYANPSRPGYNNQYQFIDPKPEGVFRIFIVGESAAKGYPQPRNLASSAFLQAMLADAWPDRTVEVINLGTTAVASFPVLGMLKEALEFEPDLIIIHTGHNEFFGAYGVNSISGGGASAAQLRLTRFVRSLAIVQALSPGRRSESDLKGKSLMEIMVGDSYTGPRARIRDAAASNLQANISEMVRRCREADVPVVVCTLPCNERDLHPIGADRVEGLGEEEALKLNTLLDRSASLVTTDPMAALQSVEEALLIQPDHAKAHFIRGQALYGLGEWNRASEAFIRARDIDSMPWRATTAQQEAVREAAEAQGVPVCDMEATFRATSPGGCIGWELMDDHVHPTLRGQALMAESLVSTLGEMTGPVVVSEDALKRVRPWEEYAEELGDNPYDRYGSDYAMLKLFRVPFVSERNPAGLRRFRERTAAFEKSLSPEMKAIAHEWQSVTPHAGGKRPITGMVARQLMREKRFEEALEYYLIAQKSVPEYTSWYLEYVYFALACREKLQGTLTEEDRAEAKRAIEQGMFLLARGFSQTGLTERYVGRLHQLRGEWADAIPFLNASRQKLSGFDLVAADQALFMSLVKTGRRAEARELAAFGVANSGQYAQFYTQMLQLLQEEPQKVE